MDSDEVRAREAAVPSAAPPHRVRLPVNVHRWDRIAFLHWRYDPAVVAALLPPELAVATFDGAAWVGVTPFVMRVRLPGVPLPPSVWTFPETNVRTYAIGPDGRQGLWFLRLEAGATWFVATLRAMGLPYARHRMAVTDAGDEITYRSRPRGTGTGTGTGGHHIVVRPGAPMADGPLDRFLTARWQAYHRVAGRLLATPVDHPPWPLRRAEVVRGDVASLLRAAGLPPADGDPLVHASDGVDVRVGVPHRARDRRR